MSRVFTIFLHFYSFILPPNPQNVNIYTKKALFIINKAPAPMQSFHNTKNLFVRTKATHTNSISKQTQRKNLVRKNKAFFLKSGGYLSSQRLTVSTFGVKELNFCVRNGNRWILFAIVTAMVIYLVVSHATYSTFVLILED